MISSQAMLGNVNLLCLLLLFSVCAGLLMVAALTGVRLIVWRVGTDTESARVRRACIVHNGAVIRPAVRGLCNSCAQVAAVIYYLPSGERRCSECQRKQQDQ